MQMNPTTANAGPGASRPVLDQDVIDYAAQVFDLIRGGQAERLRPLLAHGLPPNLCNQNGDSLLMLASYNGHYAVAQALLDHGADTELRNERDQSPLAGAAFKGDIDMLRLLLEGGALVDGAGGDGRTALMFAAMFNRTEAVRVLLDHGAQHERRDARGMCAFDLAIAMGAEDTRAQLSV